MIFLFLSWGGNGPVQATWAPLRSQPDMNNCLLQCSVSFVWSATTPKFRPKDKDHLEIVVLFRRLAPPVECSWFDLGPLLRLGCVHWPAWFPLDAPAGRSDLMIDRLIPGALRGKVQYL